jgi:hypothetical protein
MVPVAVVVVGYGPLYMGKQLNTRVDEYFCQNSSDIVLEGGASNQVNINFIRQFFYQTEF